MAGSMVFSWRFQCRWNTRRKNWVSQNLIAMEVFPNFIESLMLVAYHSREANLRGVITGALLLRAEEIPLTGNYINGIIESQHQLWLFRLHSLERLAWWFRAKWPDSHYTIEDIFWNPNECGVGRKLKASRAGVCWISPPPGHVKFNVDGSVFGVSNKAGIGGIFRDEGGRALITFSKSIVMASPHLAEILAVKEACVLFCFSKWKGSHALMVECDSRFKNFYNARGPTSIISNVQALATGVNWRI
ncbi:hypothetical protein J1N35_044721 [Gossypium stocksii]|uniref:RNase H type-1 domain-containing protein n=1 Tax=Gossypium stocksii TaxID=47602 RepID=A0A9D3U9T2_9ROSI|nr:hypothetical protein J1N35_044721 [Gossypium stocksii]